MTSEITRRRIFSPNLFTFEIGAEGKWGPKDFRIMQARDGRVNKKGEERGRFLCSSETPRRLAQSENLIQGGNNLCTITPATVAVTPNNLARELEQFLAEARDALVLEDGEPIFELKSGEMGSARYSI